MSKASKPPEIWMFETINDSQAAELTERLLYIGDLAEDEEMLGVFIKLIAGISAWHESYCHCNRLCEKDVTWAVLKAAYIRTQSFNDAFFRYVVNDLKIARDFRPDDRKKGGAR